MSYETEKTFSLNPCKGFKGKMEVNGKDVYISGVEKSTRDGSRNGFRSWQMIFLLLLA